MTWADFKADVLEELGVDGTRRGIEDLRNRAMRDAAIDLQRFIRAYRQGNTTTYQANELTAVGYAHLGTLPAQAKPKAFYTVSVVPKADATLPNPNIARNRLDFVAWEDRRERMIDRKHDARKYLYTISPFSTQFLVHPLINDETYLLVVWDGLKMNFADGDTVPWPEQAAEAVAAYVKWRILLVVDKRLDLAREWYDKAKNTGIYPGLRLALFREQNEAQAADGKDEEYSGTNITPPTGAGAQASYVSLNAADTSVAVVFPTAYDNTPIVNCWIVGPDGSAFIIGASPQGDSITNTGFTAMFAGAIPDSGYKLFWEAQPSS